MIAYISWKIIDITKNSVIILTNSWLGYEVLINEITYSKVCLEENIDLFLYHSISENGQNLFWFIEKEERAIFEELIKISWIGWKVALNILSVWIENLIWAIKNEDQKTMESIKWIWKKWASKIILELKDKDFIKNSLYETKKELDGKKSTIPKDLFEQVKETLVNMWYNSRDIEKVLIEVPEESKTLNEIIPFVIRNI